MRRRLAGIIGPPVCGGMLLALPSCIHVKTDPIKVEPIHIVADINIKVERQLDDFFAFEKQYDKQAPATNRATPATTAPAVDE